MMMPQQIDHEASYSGRQMKTLNSPLRRNSALNHRLQGIIRDSDAAAVIVPHAMQDLLLSETRKRRQAEGIAIAKKSGIYTGRKPDLKRREVIRTLRKQSLSYQKIAEMTGCSVATVYRAVNEK